MLSNRAPFPPTLPPLNLNDCVKLLSNLVEKLKQPNSLVKTNLLFGAFTLVAFSGSQGPGPLGWFGVLLEGGNEAGRR